MPIVQAIQRLENIQLKLNVDSSEKSEKEISAEVKRNENNNKPRFKKKKQNILNWFKIKIKRKLK